MTARVDEELANDPRFAATGLPREVLHKISFMAMKENFGRFVTNSLPSMQMALSYFASEAPSFMRTSQNKALSAGLAPDARTAALCKFQWTVQQAPEGGLVLPDCVALGVEDDSQPQPLIMSDLDKLDYVLMPLTPEKILVGSRTPEENLSLEQFNYDAAACSHDFFISNRDGPDRAELITLLGSRSRLTVEEAIGQAFEGFKMAYRFDGDMDKLMAVTLPAVAALLDHIGHLLGHCDGVQRVAFDDEPLEAAFEKAGLRAWVDLFHGDLATIWDRRGQWSSIDEFFLLNRHTERLLWAFGMFPWKTDGGVVWIKVPYGEDTPHLQGVQPILRKLWMRFLGYLRGAE